MQVLGQDMCESACQVSMPLETLKMSQRSRWPSNPTMKWPWEFSQKEIFNVTSISASYPQEQIYHVI